MNKEFILKYLNGELSPADKEKLLLWIKKDESNAKLFSSIKNSWSLTRSKLAGNQIPDFDINQEFELFQQKVTAQNGKKSIALRKHTIGWAAAVLILLLYGIYITVNLSHEKQDITYNTISTRKGEKSKLILADGTTIWLNSETTLRYPTKVNTKKVKLFLQGEAYFDVTKNKKREFIVKTSTIDISVLGTQFNVKSYKDDKIVETTLEKGKIAITGKVGNKTLKKPLILKPNEQARLIINNKEIEVTNVKENSLGEGTNEVKQNKNSASQPKNKDRKTEIQIDENIHSELFTSWKDGKLMFKSEAFEDLAVKMERWFDVKITIESEDLKTKKYTGVFEKETLEQALKALSLSLPFKYIINENHVRIYNDN